MATIVYATVAVIMLLLPIEAAFASPYSEATTQNVTIQAGDVVLGATLYRPAGAKGDLPAIVTGHGSAPSTRDGVGYYTNIALAMGFAVLSFDKRGTGESTGKYESFTVEDSPRVFQDLAMDIVYAVRWLAEQPGIDESRIGLFGGSQAGWIMPLAASRESLVSFAIIGEGVPLTAGEENAHEAHLMAASHDGADDITPEMVAAADAALATYDGDPGYDPASVLQSLEIPVLWIFGFRDTVIPIAPSLARLEALIRSGKTNNDVHVFAFGDHNFTNVSTGERYDVRAVAEIWLKRLDLIE